MVACRGFLPEERHWGCAVEKGWQGGPRTPRHFWHGVFAALLRRWPGRCPDGWCLRFCLHTSFHPLCEWAWPSLPADRGWIFQYRVNKKIIWKKKYYATANIHVLTFLKDISTTVSPLKLKRAMASPYSSTCTGTLFFGWAFSVTGRSWAR